MNVRRRWREPLNPLLPLPPLLLPLALSLALSAYDNAPMSPDMREIAGAPLSPPATEPLPPPAARTIWPRGEPGPARILEPGWSQPIKLRFNDGGWEDSPYITRDGSRILFFYHPWPDLIAPGVADKLTEYVISHPQEAIAKGLDGKIYVSPRPFEKKTVHPISRNKTYPTADTAPYLAISGALYYNSTKESFVRGKGVPVTVYRNGKRLDFGTGADESNPHYCAALDELWFDCPGDQNLCIMARAKASGFKGPVQRAPHPINARNWRTVADAQAFLTDDCKTLYFSSDRKGGILKIYRTRRLGRDRWSPPELFVDGPLPVAELSMTADGRELIFSQVTWKGKGGTIDIYYARRR